VDELIFLSNDPFYGNMLQFFFLLYRLGDYVIVGVHNDSVVNQRRGMNLPIMNMHERVLSVLGCKVCDIVVVCCSAFDGTVEF
jgi:ethanolamine-phosphate cytidylyltransferase